MTLFDRLKHDVTGRKPVLRIVVVRTVQTKRVSIHYRRVILQHASELGADQLHCDLKTLHHVLTATLFSPRWIEATNTRREIRGDDVTADGHFAAFLHYAQQHGLSNGHEHTHTELIRCNAVVNSIYGLDEVLQEIINKSNECGEARL